MNCNECGAELGRRNKSGYCRRHVSKATWSNADYRERHKAGIRQRIATDPGYLDGLRKRAAALGRDESLREKKSAVFRAGEYWKLGSRAAGAPGSPARVKAGRSITSKRLAWCPHHLRGEYLALINRHHFRASEARKMIEEQHDLEMARWRRNVGVAAA